MLATSIQVAGQIAIRRRRSARRRADETFPAQSGSPSRSRKRPRSDPLGERLAPSMGNGQNVAEGIVPGPLLITVAGFIVSRMNAIAFVNP